MIMFALSVLRLGIMLLIPSGIAVPQDSTSAQAGKVSSDEKPALPRYLEVRPNIGTGGQPTEAGLRVLAEKGYKSIINFRTAAEMAAIPYQEKLAAELGLKYFSIPINGQDPKETQFQAFDQLMDALKDEKVFVHCTAANRVGALLMIRLALREGLDTAKAESEAEKIGLRSDVLRQFARQVIERERKN